MAQIEDSSRWMSCQLFTVAPDVELREILGVASEIYNANGEIEASILRDQETAALEKRKLRDADKQWQRRRSESGVPTLLDVEHLFDGRRR